MLIKIGNRKIWGGLNAITLLLVCSLAYYPVNAALNTLVNKYIQQGVLWDTALCAGLYLIAVLNALPLLIKRQTKASAGLFCVAILVFAGTIGLGLDGADVAKGNIVSFFLLCFPFAFVGVAIQNFEDLDKPIDIVTRIIIVVSIIWTAIVVFQVNRGLRVAYMGISYYVLPTSLFRVYYYFRDRGYTNLIWMLAGIACQIIWGTRGPVLFTFVFVALCILMNSRSKKGVFMAILLVIAGILSYTYFFDILNWSNDIFIEMDLKNGGILKLLNDEDLSDGRMDIYSEIIPYIHQHFVIGGGVFADRTVIGRYTHLLPLELMCDFGVILGTIVFLTLLVFIVKKVVIVKKFADIRWALLWVILISGFFKLFVSGSYLQEPYFYFLLGLLANSYVEETLEINTEI